jgi:CheY-like chemotaxis protein
VADGREAVRVFERERFQIGLMDCQMPELDGHRATEEIRRFEKAAGLPRTPIIALTANVMPKDRENALAAGMDDHLPKPFERADLRRVLARFAALPDVPEPMSIRAGTSPSSST